MLGLFLKSNISSFKKKRKLLYLFKGKTRSQFQKFALFFFLHGQGVHCFALRMQKVNNAA